MKKFNILKVMMMAVISISAMTFASCDNDDDEPVNTLKLNPAKVEIAPKATATVTIGSGMTPVYGKLVEYEGCNGQNQGQDNHNHRCCRG